MSTDQAHAVAGHYDRQPRRDRLERREERTGGIRAFNNWCKSVLIDLALQGVPRRAPVHVLDLACGVGGDLGKYAMRARSHNVRGYVGVDASARSIHIAQERQAEERAARGSGRDLDVRWVVADLGEGPAPLPADAPAPALVSCQFALHYACSDTRTLLSWLSNAAGPLARGGRFVCTYPNAETLGALHARSGAPRVLEDAAAGWSMEFDLGTDRDCDRDEDTQGDGVAALRHAQLGQRYLMSLDGSLTRCPEYMAPFVAIETLAARLGLRVERRWRALGELFAEFSGTQPYHERLFKMKLAEPGSGRLLLSEAQWNFVQLYEAVLFVKDE